MPLVNVLPIRVKYFTVIIPLAILSTWAVTYFFTEFLFRGDPKGVVPLIICFLVNGLVLSRFKPLAEDAIANIHQRIKILSRYESVIKEIENGAFHSERLLKLKSIYLAGRNSVSSSIKHLRVGLELFQLRGSKRQLNHFFYSIFNNLWFLDFYLILFTEKWRLRNRDNFGEWTEAINEFEVLGSIAEFSYVNPSYLFPEISEERLEIDFRMLGHPLIASEKRVCNDFKLNDAGAIAMITGSNMAGKSTFLRGLGVNVALALMGAPCCAASACVSSLQLFSSMRTQDNLDEGVSSFYAELKRIESLLMLIQDNKQVFFLLDEIFKGTNSKDRYKGGFSLIKQLKGLNVFGVISSHDLDLALLADRLKLVVNYCFNSRIEDDQLLFDYILRNGVCKDFNASMLMQKIGINILPGDNLD